MATRPFSDFLMDLGKGMKAQELAEGLQQLVTAVEETGKMGTINLAIKIKPNKGCGTVLVEDKVTIKLPEKEKGINIFFVTPENNLSRSDQKQMSFDTIVSLDKKTNQYKD